jgi:hypothetical protein
MLQITPTKTKLINRGVCGIIILKGEVAQTIFKHVRKCKTNKIKGEKKKKILKGHI